LEPLRIRRKKDRNPPAAKMRTLYKRSRNLLPAGRLEEFAGWAIGLGFTSEQVRGDYEVLRLRWPKWQPLRFFKSSKREYITCHAAGTELVTMWIRSDDPKKPLADRDAAILAAHRAGLVLRAIGPQFGISRERARQIIAREKVFEKRRQASDLERLLGKRKS
jgi:hypothetical protein